MVKKTNQNLVRISEESIQKEGGVVILPLKQWKKIERGLEDLEMYSSDSLAKEIAERRKEDEMVSLEELLEQYNI